MNRLRTIRDSIGNKISTPLVTIAMDGENAWEGYKNDGRDFLSYLYEGILKDPGMLPVTISEYLELTQDIGNLHHCHAGSWIGHNFSIWIGHSEDNTAWTQLAKTREFLERILNDEDRHLDGIEELQDQISHMTLPLFLSTQV